MPRQSITELIGGKGPRQHIWEAIRRLASAAPEKRFTDQDIIRVIAQEVRDVIELATLSDYRRSLVNAGILDAENDGPRTPMRCLLVRDEGLEAPRVRRNGERVTQGLAQEQMWRTLRMLSGDINSRELAAHASTTDIPVAEVAARDYLGVLSQAGYLICTKKGKGTGSGGVQARFRLKPDRNTGPRPPMVCRTRVVYDPNEDKVVYQPRVTDEDAIHAK